jgi:hypothetical protein
LRCIAQSFTRSIPRSIPRLVFAGMVAIAVPLVAGCDFFDDIQGWNKKPLTGERKPLFPEGVPGVATGLPPDLMKGYREPESQVDPAKLAAEEAARTQAAAKPKAKLPPQRTAGKPPSDPNATPQRTAGKPPADPNAAPPRRTAAKPPSDPNAAPPQRTARKPSPPDPYAALDQRAAPTSPPPSSAPQGPPLPWPGAQPQAASPSGTVAR